MILLLDARREQDREGPGARAHGLRVQCVVLGSEICRKQCFRPFCLLGPRNGGVPRAACARIEHDVNYGVAGAALLRAWLAVAGEAGRGPAQDLVLLLQLLGAPAQFTVLRLKITAPHGRRSSTSEQDATPKLRSCAPPERGTDRPDGAGPARSRRDGTPPERLGTMLILPARPQCHRQGVNRALRRPCCVALDRRGVNMTRAKTSERWEATRIPPPGSPRQVKHSVECLRPPAPMRSDP